ncbi:coiled-coil domain-containing protein 15 isoform X3 [Tupaia chinensis]|uniref:coiled-coil domain-containing protein 15 isoform X3 n=1 Tax=Tupaia chinensis TaxID=246437 RepID=UPI0003C8EA97|nr:coiled-coil domain-containing protein 15 isoform X3 [Tupaia chinensis]
MIEAELKEQLRRKQEALTRFQRQVRHRVNQQVRLRKMQQPQRCDGAAEKRGSPAMQSSGPGHFSSKAASVCSGRVEAAAGISGSPPSQVLEGAAEGGQSWAALLPQQAQAPSLTMKQARHRLASFKTVSEKKTLVSPEGGRESFPTQEKALSRKPASIRINTGIREEFPVKVHQGLLAASHHHSFMDNQEPCCEESLSIMIDEKGGALFRRNQQEFPSEVRGKALSRVPKVTFKNPLFAVIEEEEEQSHLGGPPDVLPEAQAHLMGIQSVGPVTQAVTVEVQAIAPQGQAVKIETQSTVLKTQSTDTEDGSIVLEAQNFLPPNQLFLPKDLCVLPKDQTIPPECQGQDWLPKDQGLLSKREQVLRKDQNIQPKHQDQDSLPEDKSFLLTNQYILPKDQNILPSSQDQNFLPKDEGFLPKDDHDLPKNENILPSYQDQDSLPEDQDFLPRNQHALSKESLLDCLNQDFLPKDQNFLPTDEHVLPKDQTFRPKYQSQDFLLSDEHVLLKHQNILPGSQDQGSLPEDQHVSLKDQNILPKGQDQDFLPKDEKVNLKLPPSVLPGRGARGAPPLDELRVGLCGHCQASSRGKKVHFEEPDSETAREQGRQGCSLRGYQFLPPKLWDQDLIREQQQKQCLRRGQLFMDMERGQGKEQQRQKEQERKVEKIKKTEHELHHGTEEQRALRMSYHRDLCSGGSMSEIVALPQPEEVKGAREKQQQREQESLRVHNVSSFLDCLIPLGNSTAFFPALFLAKEEGQRQTATASYMRSGPILTVLPDAHLPVGTVS